MHSLPPARMADPTTPRGRQQDQILMRRFQFPEDEAYRHLQKLSRDRRQTLKQTAQQVLDAAELLG